MSIPVLWYGSCASGRLPPSRPPPAHEGNPRRAASTDEIQRARGDRWTARQNSRCTFFLSFPSQASQFIRFRLILHGPMGGQVFA